MIYIPPFSSISNVSSRWVYLPGQVSAKIKLNFSLLFFLIHSPPSVHIRVRRLSTPKFSLAMLNRVSSLSKDIKVESLSIPSNIHAVAKPVPVPSSRKLDPGFEAAKVFNNEQVDISDICKKPQASVAFLMLSYAGGYS